MPGPREFHGSGLPVPTITRLREVSTTGDSQNAPPPYSVLPFPPLPSIVQVFEPGWPGDGTGLQDQIRAPFAALKAEIDGLLPPLSPEPSPTRTIPLT